MHSCAYVANIQNDQAYAISYTMDDHEGTMNRRKK